MFFREQKIRFRLSDLLSKNRELYKKYAAISLPVTGNELIWALGASAVAVVIGRMGTSFVAANSIYTVLNQFVTVIMFGVGNAALTIVGNTIGAGEYELAKQRSVKLLVISIFLGVLSAAVTLILSPFVISLYQISAETAGIAASISRVGALVVFFQSLAIVGMIGILRAGGDAKFVLICEASILWGIAVPLGALAGLVLKWPVWAVCLRCDEIIKVVIAVWRICGFKWLRDITVIRD